eukprot:5845783-Lingulodinium_polyedra.AAC.1
MTQKKQEPERIGTGTKRIEARQISGTDPARHLYTWDNFCEREFMKSRSQKSSVHLGYLLRA